MRAAPKLLELVDDKFSAPRQQQWLQPVKHEMLRLRGCDRQLIDYRETYQTKCMRDEIMEINEAMACINLSLNAPNITCTAHHWLTNANAILITPSPQVYRVFLRGSWRFGGRLYGFWQGLPGALRGALRLDGQPVVRPDYAQLHAQMIYAQAELPIEGDAYEIPGFSRDEVKRTFNIAINARSTRSAIGAIADSVNTDRVRATELYHAVLQRHPRISKAFGSDAGVRLMRIDSQIMISCLKSCAKAGIPALPVHDELIVPSQHGDRVVQIMIESFERQFSPITPCRVKLY
jgi:hypothetical protein